MTPRGVVTKGIVLARTDFGEADRILTILTPDYGKVRLIAKGVRKIKSKLAGGIELFSLSDITFIPSRKEINTLISSRLDKHFDTIVKNIDRTMFGYECLKLMDRITEDGAEADYFALLLRTLEGLDTPNLELEQLELWLHMHLLKLGGHSPQLKQTSDGSELKQGKSYVFSFDDMAFSESENGPFGARHVKLLRLAIGLKEATKLQKVTVASDVLQDTQQLAKTMLGQYVKV